MRNDGEYAQLSLPHSQGGERFVPKPASTGEGSPIMREKAPQRKGEGVMRARNSCPVKTDGPRYSCVLLIPVLITSAHSGAGGLILALGVNPRAGNGFRLALRHRSRGWLRLHERACAYHAASVFADESSEPPSHEGQQRGANVRSHHFDARQRSRSVSTAGTGVSSSCRAITAGAGLSFF